MEIRPRRALSPAKWRRGATVRGGIQPASVGRMAHRKLTISSRSVLALALVEVACAGVAGTARAQTVPSEEPPPAFSARALVGFGSGIAVDAWLPGRRVRVDLDAETAVPDAFDRAGVAVIVPVAGTARRFFGLRAGDALEYTATRAGWISGSHFAQAPDAGVVVHLESAGGSTLEGQLGVEAVLRQEATICCDDAPLPTSSLGVRIGLRGELALSDTWALVAQAGLGTAAHLLEIGLLPTFAVGVRARF